MFLGDIKLGVKPIEDLIFIQEEEVNRGIWFYDGNHGIQELGAYWLPKEI